MVPAASIDVIDELLRQSRTRHAPPFLICAFGDFLQHCQTFGNINYHRKMQAASVFGRNP